MNRILYNIIETLIVSKCPSCGKVVRRSGTLCPDCSEKYRKELETKCRFCGMTSGVCVCSTRDLYYCKYLKRSMISYLYYAPENEVFMSALRNLKYSTDRGAEKFFARELSCGILKLFSECGEMAGDWCVTYPPRRRDAVKYYGFDHAKGLAGRIAEYTGMTFEEPIARRGGTEQKSLDSVMRAKNAENSFRLKKDYSVEGKKYVIVDDVVTSGATMRACQTCLLSGGAAAAFVMSIAKTSVRGAGYDVRRRFVRRKKRENTNKGAWFSK